MCLYRFHCLIYFEHTLPVACKDQHLVLVFFYSRQTSYIEKYALAWINAIALFICHRHRKTYIAQKLLIRRTSFHPYICMLPEHMLQWAYPYNEYMWCAPFKSAKRRPIWCTRLTVVRAEYIMAEHTVLVVLWRLYLKSDYNCYSIALSLLYWVPTGLMALLRNTLDKTKTRINNNRLNIYVSIFVSTLEALPYLTVPQKGSLSIFSYREIADIRERTVFIFNTWIYFREVILQQVIEHVLI